MSSNAIVLSIRPQYATKIFAGIKKVELRRIRPKHVSKGSLVLIYVSSPAQSLKGAFKVDKIIEKPLSDLWVLVQDTAGITENEFYDYYAGVSTGVGIFFTEVSSLPEPIKMQDWQEQGISFSPPQGFRYVTADELALPQIAELAEEFKVVVQTSFLDEDANKSCVKREETKDPKGFENL